MYFALGGFFFSLSVGSFSHLHFTSLANILFAIAKRCQTKLNFLLVIEFTCILLEIVNQIQTQHYSIRFEYRIEQRKNE